MIGFGRGSRHDRNGMVRSWIRIDDTCYSLGSLQHLGILDRAGLDRDTFDGPSLSRFFEQGPDVWRSVIDRCCDYHTSRVAFDERPAMPVDWIDWETPIDVGDYVDFYSSIHHASNLGRLFRPDSDPLLPNWRQLPVGYHGRSGTIVRDRAPIVRPSGLRLVDGAPAFGPSERLDIEVELGTVIGVGSTVGSPIDISTAADHLFGICLINDWSARDIQAFEYQPLGPFLGKSFATTISNWIVPFCVLDDYRVEPPEQHPPVADYLRHPDHQQAWGFDLHFSVELQSEAMRVDGHDPIMVSGMGFADQYWTAEQQLAHLTVNGASVRPCDLFASGTVSGPHPGSEGSLIELTANGDRPIELPTGELRSFLADGDTVTITGYAGAERSTRRQLGSVTGRIEPATTNHRTR